MFVPTGMFVSIPLTVMQGLTLHGATDAWPSAPTLTSLFALNVALAHGIYDFDRLRDIDEAERGVYKATTRTACAMATVALCSREETRALAPVVPLLHFEYSRMKPSLASVKPFFVASMWGAATTLMPIYWSGTPVDQQALMGLMMINTFQLCASSNLADVRDIDDDFDNDIFTPAVLLGPANAYKLTVLALIAAAALRAVHPWTDGFLLAYDASNAFVTYQAKAVVLGEEDEL